MSAGVALLVFILAFVIFFYGFKGPRFLWLGHCLAICLSRCKHESHHRCTVFLCIA